MAPKYRVTVSAAYVSSSYVSWSQSRAPWLERLSILLYRLLFTVGWTTATLLWLEWLKFIFRNFSLWRTWLLVWCLECAVVNTSPQFLKIYRFHALELQLENEVLQSTDQPHGTVCHQHYGHRTCRRAPSSGHWKNAPVLDHPVPLRRLRDSGAGYKYPDLLSFLLTYLRTY